MCAAELTWYTLKVYNGILMKHIWWNWHAIPGTAYRNKGHTAGTLRKIGIYLFWEIIDIYMSHEIFLKYFIEYLFFCSTHGFDIELHDILYSILYKLYILRIGVLDWYIHCARVWYEIIKIVEHSLDFHLGSCKPFDEVENVSSNLFFLIQDFVLKSWNMHYFSF